MAIVNNIIKLNNNNVNNTNIKKPTKNPRPDNSTLTLKDILKDGNKTNVETDISIIDNDWIKSRFMVPDYTLDEVDAFNRYVSTSYIKFTDSSLGGNIAINPWPQFTRYADIRYSNRGLTNPVTKTSDKGGYGMGRLYSEMEDYREMIYMQFGVPRFNGLTDFFTRAIDYEDMVVANTGRASVGYTFGKVVGNLGMLAAFPMITVAIWTGKAIYGAIFGHGAFKYYYLEPTMHTYWGTVNTIVTQLATELGILIPEFMPEKATAKQIGAPIKLDKEDLQEIRKLLPGLISENGYIDVYAIATKAQSRANKLMIYEESLYSKFPSIKKDFKGYLKVDGVSEMKGTPGSSVLDKINAGLTFSQYLNKLKNTKLYEDKGDQRLIDAENAAEAKPGDYNAGNSPDRPVNQNSQFGQNEQYNTQNDSLEAVNASREQRKYKKDADGTYKYDIGKANESYIGKLLDAIDSSVREGGLYAVFYVNDTGSVTESFSNSIGTIDTGNIIKSLSTKAYNIKFDLAGGNITTGIEEALSATKNVIAGVLDSVSFGLSSVISTITGNAYIDIPKKWEDSEVSLPSINYTIELRSPYNNPISQLQNIYIPLAMILAGALPKATGKASYTSPYLCSLFNKGKQKISLGMITSLTITRGVNNLGFSKDKRNLGIDVSFTVTDLSSVMAAPVNSTVFSEFNVILEDDTLFGEYMATIASRNLLASKYIVPRWKRKLSRMLMIKDRIISASNWGMRIGESLNKVLGSLVADHSLALTQR